MKEDIYNIASQCKKIIKEKIEVSYNKIINKSRGLIFTDYNINGEIKLLETNLLMLVESLETKYPAISQLLQKHIDRYDDDKIIHLSAIEAIVDCVISLEKKDINSKRIFISHSSKDKDIVEKFIDNILQLGIGIKAEDIFCTSVEKMGIKNGSDIRKHIQTNIRSADYAFLLISKNYKASEICINEMGAVWAYDNNVRLYILPDVDFKEIGWLCDTRKADRINTPVPLDALHKEMIEYFELPDKGTWSRQREVFIKYVNGIQTND
jgi:hypothetical protein